MTKKELIEFLTSLDKDELAEIMSGNEDEEIEVKPKTEFSKELVPININESEDHPVSKVDEERKKNFKREKIRDQVGKITVNCSMCNRVDKIYKNILYDPRKPYVCPRCQNSR